MPPTRRGNRKHTVTGANFVFVRTTRQGPQEFIQVYEGQDLPDDVADGEIERLEALGVFEEHPRETRKRLMEHAINIGGMTVIPGPERSIEELRATMGGVDDDDEVAEHLGEQ